ncbi:amino acid transporter [Microbacterium sp. bgisy203]|uniref:amino acid transporter n=1 Tax=Microbacterium sp. bgisy203 TaxID=3413799 RepID=UPI003D75232C
MTEHHPSDPQSEDAGRAPTRRDLMKPVQLLGFAFAAALFAGIITLVSMGFFQDLSGDQRMQVVIVSLIVAGIAFIATLVIIALLMLAVDPAQVAKPVDRAVLLPESENGGESPDAAASDDSRS